MSKSKIVKIQGETETFIEKMTPKQARFLTLWLKSGNGTKAAMEAYDTDDPNVAGAIASENLRKLRNPTKLFLESRGLTINSLADVVYEALKAEKTDITGDKHPDHRVRLEASDRLAKWLDVEPKDVNIAQQSNYQFIFTRGEEDKNE